MTTSRLCSQLLNSFDENVHWLLHTLPKRSLSSLFDVFALWCKVSLAIAKNSVKDSVNSDTRFSSDAIRRSRSDPFLGGSLRVMSGLLNGSCTCGDTNPFPPAFPCVIFFIASRTSHRKLDMSFLISSSSPIMAKMLKVVSERLHKAYPRKMYCYQHIILSHGVIFFVNLPQSCRYSSLSYISILKDHPRKSILVPNNI